MAARTVKNKKLLDEIILKDEATLIDEYTKIVEKTTIQFTCKCGTEHQKEFRKCIQTGVFCPKCANINKSNKLKHMWSIKKITSTSNTDHLVNTELIIHEYADSTPIISKKYKTIGHLKQASLLSMIQTVTRMNKSTERDYLDKWIFDTHYSNQTLYGNLTMRIRPLNNIVCYREIMRRCFNSVNILANVTTTKILTDRTLEFIKDLHNISPSGTGIFIDYLIRRIICEIKKNLFTDSRASCITQLGADSTHICGSTALYDKYSNKELKNICKKNNISGFSNLNKEKLIDLIVSKLHKCKMTINCMNKCVLPVCQKLSYEKAKNTNDYKTADIILDIFITSLLHSEAFGHGPQQEDFNLMYNTIKNKEDIINILVMPLTELCTNMIYNKADILLNPALGCKGIPADADLVIDDELIDIKCTNSTSSISEILQLLAYSSLLMVNPLYNKKINKISIMNILKGSITSYDIDYISHDQCNQYINILTNV